MPFSPEALMGTIILLFIQKKPLSKQRLLSQLLLYALRFRPYA
jgi:hypothetical protein